MANIDKMAQKIWCISSDKLFEKGKWQGLQTKNLDYYLDLLNKESIFLPRGPLEEDDSFKQIIGQVTLQVGNEFLLHQITSEGSESRLHDLWPLFLGGHIDETDKGHENVVEYAADREFNEEVKYEGNILEKKFLGLVYVEDGNFVNHVHVGMCFLFKGDSKKVTLNENKLANLKFVDVDYLNANIKNLTYWSREIIPLLSTLVNTK